MPGVLGLALGLGLELGLALGLGLGLGFGLALGLELAAVDALQHKVERLGRGDHLTQADDALAGRCVVGERGGRATWVWRASGT